MPRPKGSMNKDTKAKFALSRLKAVFGDDFDPLIRMAEMATLLHAEAQATEDNKAQAIKAAIDGWDKVGQYCNPKLKAVEISGTEGSDLPAISVTIVRGKGGDSDTGGV